MKSREKGMNEKRKIFKKHKCRDGSFSFKKNDRFIMKTTTKKQKQNDRF